MELEEQIVQLKGYNCIYSQAVKTDPRQEGDRRGQMGGLQVGDNLSLFAQH